MKPSVPHHVESRARARARWLLGIALALMGAGIWRIDGVLGALGLAGIVLIVLARWLGRANLRRLAITMELPRRASASSAYPLRVTLANTRRWLDAFGITLTARFPGDASVRFRSHWIAAGSAADFDGHATPNGRAVGEHAAITLESDFPLGLFSQRARTTHAHAMIVFPRVRVPRETPGDGVMLDASPLAGATHGSAGGDLRGLRPWRPGDRPREIAWPATMRALACGATPLVRETDPPGFLPRRCLIVVHSFASGGALIRPERFERALELTGGWIERLHALGIRARVIADFDDWRIRAAANRADIIHCREGLARAHRRNSTEAHELQQAIRRTATDDETVILLSDMPAEFWQNHIPPGSPASRISHL